jgi:hypothetical protein
MKERILKIGVVLFLIALLVVAGVYPVTSQAAAKGTTYKVVLQKGSVSLSIVSINDGASVPQLGSLENTSFQIVVESKVQTEKVKSTGATAQYYPVTLLAKSVKSPTVEYPMIGGGGTAIKSLTIPKDGKGKLYISSGGDVDFFYSFVLVYKKATVKFGDGKPDVKGSMFIPIITNSNLTSKETGKKMQVAVQQCYLTTGTCSIIAQGIKGGVNGKSLSADDTTKTLSKPLMGVPVDLDAGTGTVVSCSASMNAKNTMVNGTVDNITGQVWIMKISKK